MADHHHHHQPEDHQVNMELPPGFRFHPTDEEIITHYLREKVLDSSFAAAAIADADFNKCEPWDLPKKAKMGEKEWYFFSQRDRKYPTGMRTNRATQTGYWKATGKDKEIYTNNNKATTGRCLVGMKKTLVFYTGRAPKGHKSNWVMHEFRLIGNHNFSSHHFNYNNLPKDEWVVCRVFHKNSNNNNNMIKKPISPPILTVEDMLEYSSSSLPPLADVVSSPNNNYATTTILSSTTTTNSHHHHHHHHHMFHNNNNNNMMASTSTSTADFSQSMCQPHQDTINAEISSSMPSDHHGLFDLSYWDDYYLLSN